MKLICSLLELNQAKKMLIAIGKSTTAVDEKATEKGIVLDSEAKIKDDLKKGK